MQNATAALGLVLAAIGSTVSEAAEDCHWPAHEQALASAVDTDQGTRKELATLFREFTARRKVDGLATESGRPAATDEEKERWLAASRAAAKGADDAQALIFPLIERCGWPAPQGLSTKAADAPWLILQHANLVAQLKYQGLVEKAVREGHVAPQKYALLVDRIRVRQGRPQLYGSQLVTDASGVKATLSNIEDEANLDSRRLAIGLKPICEYIAGFAEYEPGEVYKPCRINK